MSISAPNKITLPFANGAGSSYKNTIPVTSQIGITNGAASYTDGFPPLTMKSIAQGGVPPFGQDMNGILYALSSTARYLNAGGCYTYDSTFANDSNVGGYPLGATLLRADGAGFWFNQIAGNTTDPDGSSASGWYPGPTVGVTTLTLSNTNKTLTNSQGAKDVLILSGTITANINIILPAFVGMRWVVYNNTVGSYTITVKTATGTGIAVPTGYSMDLYCDGDKNISSAVTNVNTATKWATPRTINLTGFVNGTMSLDGSSNVSMSTVYGSGFNASKTSNGYTYLPNGLIMQWGIMGGIATDQSLPVSFPIRFPNAVLNITTSHVESASSGSVSPSACSIQSGYNTTGFTLIQDTYGNNAVNEMWFAIGY